MPVPPTDLILSPASNQVVLRVTLGWGTIMLISLIRKLLLEDRGALPQRIHLLYNLLCKVPSRYNTTSVILKKSWKTEVLAETRDGR